MAVRQVIAASLALMLAVGASPLLAQQQGTISGNATDEAESPYRDFTVRIVRPDTGEVVGSQVLDAQGLFAIGKLPIGEDYIVELVQTTENNEIVCTEGPFNLTSEIVNLTDVNIDCGSPPAALYIIAGVAGLVSAAGLLTQSESGTPTP
jgi:hypothetical protein